MLPASNTLLALILVALGILGVILSFLVPDQRKSLLSRFLAGLIIVIGGVYFLSHLVSDYKMKRRFSSLREQRQIDLDKLREDFQKRAAESAPPAASQTKK